MEPKEIGELGENIASYFLEKKGYKILERNYFNLGGEIDIIAQKDDLISFVEVKTLSLKDSVFFPEDKVDFKKQDKIIKLAQKWLEDKKLPLDSKWQIDVVSVKVDLDSKKARINHFKNI